MLKNRDLKMMTLIKVTPPYPPLKRRGGEGEVCNLKNEDHR
jgi:hypothetical protein